ncbi:MAG TPA: hypothetical protein VFW19_16930 [Allosphingosinicella sp.]|nr:hypothetical protein [Allosphingosinicella sp.]
MDGFLALTIGVGAALAFPVLAIAFHNRREQRHNRRMGARRTQKIRL